MQSQFATNNASQTVNDSDPPLTLINVAITPIAGVDRLRYKAYVKFTTTSVSGLGDVTFTIADAVQGGTVVDGSITFASPGVADVIMLEWEDGTAAAGAHNVTLAMSVSAVGGTATATLVYLAVDEIAP